MADEAESVGSSPQSLALSPAQAVQTLYLAVARSLADATRNAVTAQQQCNVTTLSSTTMGIATLYSLATATVGVASHEELDRAIGKAKDALSPTKA